MILYQDTSSVLKCYVLDEVGVPETRRAVEQSDFVATSLVAYTEVRAALARVEREGRLGPEEHAIVLAEFKNDWREYIKVSISPSLIESAGELAERHALRAYDAVHLASAVTLRDSVLDYVSFSSWDDDLTQAAVSEGLQPAH